MKYNKSEIFRNAWANRKETGKSLSECLKKAWAEAKSQANETKKNVVVKTYYSYNQRRYSLPWVCKVENGNYNFEIKVGMYTANHGDEGNLIVFTPVIGQVYAYGQKDYRGGKTEKNFIVWNGNEFVPCDKIGTIK